MSKTETREVKIVERGYRIVTYRVPVGTPIARLWDESMEPERWGGEFVRATDWQSDEAELYEIDGVEAALIDDEGEEA